MLEESVFFSAQDGLRLHARLFGARQTARLPVVCLPGLTRNTRDFEALARILASDADEPRQVIAFDYRGRGRSAWDKDWTNYTVLTEAGDVLAGLAALDIAQAHMIGTSRGGLILHLLAAMRPGAMKSVVLNDVGPELGGAGMMQIRTYLDRRETPKDWDDARRIIAQGHARGFPALSPEEIDRMAHAVFREDEHGRIAADHDPALINTLRAIDPAAPLPTLWPQFAGLAEHRLMVIRGENSMLLTEDIVARMKAAAPAMQALTVAGQGHAPLLETGALPKQLKAFFAKAEA